MNNSEILIYQTADDKIKIDVRLEDETVWLTLDHMAGLFGKSKKTISEHIRNIFREGELDGQVVVRNFRITTAPGVSPKTDKASGKCRESLRNASGKIQGACREKPSITIPT